MFHVKHDLPFSCSIAELPNRDAQRTTIHSNWGWLLTLSIVTSLLGSPSKMTALPDLSRAELS
ncbi:hypothetical protein HD598_001505 [Neomicrococcus aestuarii]|uniref:Uncharacterized protein n=1 Tax=Neomicrococcus aestuarii TaxID=556325 RepID=A0A7W8TVL0_9MICC|nr:hypothetical protein [Neomicrococcus aestuarii]